jgi:hypothetical protein
MLEAARGLPDLLKARREAMEARWRGEAAGRRCPTLKELAKSYNVRRATISRL